MVTTLGILAAILAAVVGTWVVYRMAPNSVERTISVAEKLRWAFGLAFLALAAYHLLRSGNPVYITAAVLGFAFLTGYALVERPWKSTI